MLLTDDDAIRALNKTHRGKDHPTNVLSFPLATPDAMAAVGEHTTTAPLMLGDIILAWGIIAAEARQQEKSMAAHVVHLTVHGMLHLLGYDHQIEEDATEMEALEISILSDMGIANPYVARDQAQPDPLPHPPHGSAGQDA